MIDFSTLKGLTIPEGVVTQITDAAGNVLWSAVEKVAITLYTLSGWNGTYAYLSHNGTTYTSPTTFEAAVGDTIHIVAGDTSRYGGMIAINGTYITTSDSTATYDYTVVRDAEMDVYGDSSEAWVQIYEHYAISINQTANGTLATSETVGASLTVTLTATPDDGYVYGGATVTYADGTTYATLDSSTLTFTMPAGDVIVTPVWNEIITFSFYYASNLKMTGQAEEGMTWAAWCESAYNTTGCYASDGQVFIAVTTYEGYWLYQCTPSDVIVDGGEYALIAAAGSGGGDN